jgi:S-formylglutathione hydrolase FrmB
LSPDKPFNFMKYFILFISLIFSLSATAATVDTAHVFSTAMNKNIPCIVILPEKTKSSPKKFPVVYLLHGYSGNYKSWLGFPDIKADADRYQIIIVCPDGGFSSWYLDSPMDSSFKYETFMAKELIPYIDQNYKTIPDREHRGISGLSMGGHGAFYLALRHKDIFGAVASMSGGVDIRPFPKNWDLSKRLGTIAEHPENWEKNTVINLVDSLKNKELRIEFDCGTADFFINVNRALNQKLLNMGIEHDYTERPGAHSNTYWGNSLGYQMLFFNKFFTNTGY